METPEKITAAIAVFGKLNLADAGMIRMLLTHGGRSVIRASVQMPQELATAIQTMASAHDFEESSILVFLAHGNTLAVQALLETPEKITTAITVFTKPNLADSGMIRVFLTHGGWSVICTFVQAPQELGTVIQTLASVHGFEESSMIALLTRANMRVVRALLETPEKITASIAVFSEMDLTDSSIISKKMFGILVYGRTLIVEILLESLEKLSNSIRVFSHNTITDPGVVQNEACYLSGTTSPCRATALQEFDDESDVGVYDDVWVVDNEIAVAEARMEGIRLRTRVSQRDTRERLLIRNQHDNIITHARQNRNRMKVCENTMPICVSGCICLPKSKRLTGNITTNIVLGEQYYCHHGSKGYHLVTVCLGILSNIRINQIYTPRRNKWSIRWIDGDLTDTHERPVTKFIIVDAHNIELVANSELVF